MATVKQKMIDTENPKFIEALKKMAQDPNEVPWIVEFAKATLEADVYEDPNCHIRGSPLFELSSIKISKDLFETMDREHMFLGPACAIQVYGHIRMVDENGNMFTLFKVDDDNAKQVILEDNLSIILGKPQLGSPRCLPKSLKLHILLKDRIRNVVFFDDWKSLGFSHHVDYDHVILDYNVQHIQSPYCRLESSLEMAYTIFHCAVLASVSVTLLSGGNDHLKLSACIKLGNSNVCHELLDDQCSKLESGAPKELCVLAVPVYSSLIIVASFQSDGAPPIVRESKFNPSDKSDGSEDKLEGLLVSVTWASASRKLPESYLREWYDNLREWYDAPSSGESESEKEEGESSKEPLRKKHRSSNLGMRERHRQKRLELNEKTSDEIGYFIQPQLEALSKRIWDVSARPHEYVEIFCVSICSFDDYNDAASSITGVIDSYQSNKLLDYFSGKEKKTGILYPHVTDKCLRGPNFRMQLDLENAIGHQISRGYLAYDDRNVEPWYDRRVCSVVIGKCGYAAVYYTIFQDARQARLNIRLMPENGVVVCLSGSIHARYSNYNYSAKYDKDYFQSTIFKKGKSFVNGGGEVPLTKSVVAVPCNGSLIVKADLRLSVDGKHVGTLKGKATFKPRDPDRRFEDPKELKMVSKYKSSSTTYDLSVNVVWGYPKFFRLR